MDRIADFRRIITTYFQELSQIPFSPNVKLRHLTVNDEKQDHYLLLTLGQHRGQRVHAIDIHVSIENQKVILLETNVDWSVLEELEARGIPTEDLEDATQTLNTIKN